MRHAGRAGIVFGVVMLALSMAAPAGAQDTSSPHQLEQTLRASGVENAVVYYDVVDGTELVRVAYRPDAGTTGPDPSSVAALVWTNAPLRFDQLVIVRGNEAPVSFDYDELASSLGPRPPGFDEASVQQWASAIGAHGEAARAVPFFVMRVAAIAALGVGITVLLVSVLVGLAFRPATADFETTLFR